MATDTPTPESGTQDSNGTLCSPVTEAEVAPYKDSDGTVHDPGFIPAIPREPQVKETMDDDDESVYPNYIEPESPEAKQFDGPVPPSGNPDAPAAEKPAPSQPAGAPAPKDAPAPGAPKPDAPKPGVPASASEAEQARIDRELSHLGHRRARKVYDWLGFFGGVVFCIFRKVALVARLGNRSRNGRTLHRTHMIELLLELLVALRSQINSLFCHSSSDRKNKEFQPVQG